MMMSNKRIGGVETYLESPLPRLREAGWRIVWFFTISTTHLVFNSFSVEQKHEFHKGANTEEK